MSRGDSEDPTRIDGSEPLPLVLHVDMDAFFASVEARSDPRLGTRPLVVGGGPGDRGVVTTASYPARRFGIRSGMSLAEARRLCPILFVVPVNPPKYIHESLAVLAILDRFSPRVEAASIDEAYVEFDPVPRTRWKAEAVARGLRIQQEILNQRALPSTVGAAVNKLQAKMASARAKPAGVSAVLPEAFLEVFGGDGVEVIPGIGPRSREVLQGLGIRTVADLSRTPAEGLRGVFGRWSGLLVGHARGEDGSPLVAAAETPDPKSAGHETTFARDTADPRELRATLWLLADRVARRLRLGGYRAQVAAVRFKVGRQRFSRQRGLPLPTDAARVLALVSWDLLERARGGRPLRLLGVAALHLVPATEEDPLFPEWEKESRMIAIGDRLRDRFGEETLLPGTVLRRRRP